MQPKLFCCLLTGIVFASTPETWTVNPQNYQYNYTLTAQLTVNSNITSDTTKILGAFINGQCRGVSEFTQSESGWMTFLLVYSNSIEPITFQYYDKEEDAVYSIGEVIVFIPNGYAGNPDAPYQLHGADLNQAPTADAGPDQVVGESYTVFLDGSGSYDPNNDALGYTWTNNAGITLPNQNIPRPSYVAPVVDEDEEHMFILHVTDGTTISDPDTVIIIIEERLSVDIMQSPIEFSVKQNYPNPFNPITSISYTLPVQSMISIIVFDMAGKEIKTLINTTQYAGRHTTVWNGTNNEGRPVGAGVYLYQIQTDSYVQSKKMVLLK
jgi:hypothetical protein